MELPSSEIALLPFFGSEVAEELQTLGKALWGTSMVTKLKPRMAVDGLH